MNTAEVEKVLQELVGKAEAEAWTGGSIRNQVIIEAAARIAASDTIQKPEGCENITQDIVDLIRHRSVVLPDVRFAMTQPRLDAVALDIAKYMHDLYTPSTGVDVEKVRDEIDAAARYLMDSALALGVEPGLGQVNEKLAVAIESATDSILAALAAPTAGKYPKDVLVVHGDYPQAKSLQELTELAESLGHQIVMVEGVSAHERMAEVVRAGVAALQKEEGEG